MGKKKGGKKAAVQAAVDSSEAAADVNHDASDQTEHVAALEGVEQVGAGNEADEVGVAEAAVGISSGVQGGQVSADGGSVSCDGGAAVADGEAAAAPVATPGVELQGHAEEQAQPVLDCKIPESSGTKQAGGELIECAGNGKVAEESGVEDDDKDETEEGESEGETDEEGSEGEDENEEDEDEDEDEEDEDDEEEEEEEEEPRLKYQRLGNSVPEILKRESASAISVHEKHLALGTQEGWIYILDFNGNELRRFGAHTAIINDLCFDRAGESIASCSDDGTVISQTPKPQPLTQTLGSRL
jgi:hypothetical protein